MVEKTGNKIFNKFNSASLMQATYLASENFQLRALFEAKDDILNNGKYNEINFYRILDGLLDAETERKLIIDALKNKDPLLMEEIIELIDLPYENVIYNIIYIKEQGFIKEIVEEEKTKKEVNGETKVETTLIYKYILNNFSNGFKENFFEPVSIVFDSGYCCNCGWCSSVCPLDAIKVSSDNLEIDQDLCIKCGLCYSVCPRSFSIDQVYNNLYQTNKSLQFSNKIGFYRSSYSGHTTNENIEEVKQDGGVVTALLEYLLANNLVDAIVAVQHSEDLWKPEPVIVDEISDLYKTAGTKYANSPSLNIIDQTKIYDRIAVVGVPCMMKALFKGALFPASIPFFTNIKIKIGLFCMESFSYDNIINLVKDKFEKELSDIVKMNIDKGKFIVNLTSGEELKVPLKEVQSYARDTCHYCDDLTSDFADISVGSIGSQAGWSSVILRSEEGEKIYMDAVKSGLIKSKKLTEVKPGKFLVEKIGGIKRKKCKPIRWKEI
ncbi:MAG: hypothetical protein GF317_21175 [Candidatus Lokiarchaeota archaeon]|nr:hypothetical protein [Candidatus Lokiarchaeota archaeon]MBD3201970.1 hypothetical protein [Candidatus Lokiarchaeota archaeon]